MRINEAQRLGFKTIAIPYRSVKSLKKKYDDIALKPIRSVFDLLGLLGL